MGSKIAGITGQISSDEHKSGRPLLTAILVNVRGVPGPGFFGLTRILGRLESEQEDDEQAYWQAEKKAVYEEWKIVLHN